LELDNLVMKVQEGNAKEEEGNGNNPAGTEDKPAEVKQEGDKE